MEILNAMVLGLLQGITEFLPVSSSGHLVLLQNFLGMTEPELLLDISLHMGTLLAVCAVFSSEIRSIINTTFRLPALYKKEGNLRDLFETNQDVKMVILVIIGSIPTALIGFFFHKNAHKIFGSVWIAGTMLLITGVLLWFTRYVNLSGRTFTRMKFFDAIVVGIVQGLAILPGISRSGSTISAALFLGIDREVSGRYSFLLCIPAICGAMLLELKSSLGQSTIPLSMILMGTLFAAVTGFMSLKILLKIVKNGRLHYFSPYCWAIGGFVLLLQYFRL